MKDWILLFVVFFSVALCTGFLRSLTETDCISYLHATEAFWKGVNPYTRNFYSDFHSTLFSPVLYIRYVWNPPGLFVLLLPLLYIPSFLILTTIHFLTLLSVCFMSSLGFQMYSGKPIRAFSAGLLSLCTIQMGYELYLAQITTIFAGLFFVGVALFLKRKDFIAGMFLSVACYKPHIFLLSSLVLLGYTFKHRRWLIVVGGVCMLCLTSIVVHIINPTIWVHWLYREQWPIDYLGSSLLSLLRAVFPSDADYYKLLLVIVFLNIFFLGYLFKLKRPFQEKFFLATLFNPILSPYGFIVDQGYLVFCAGCLLAQYCAHSSEDESIWSMRVGLFCMLSILGVHFDIAGLPLFWFLPAPLLMLLTIYSNCQKFRSTKEISVTR